jgi:hypothetical protein
MAFDFKAAISSAKKDLSSNNLFLLLLGASGSGKSHSIGTLGVKTLYLYTKTEDHGPKAAAMTGGSNVVPLSIDTDGDSNLSSDATLERLSSILSDTDGLKANGFKAIVIDSMTDLETIFRSSTKVKATVLKNKFAEGPALADMFKDLIITLKSVQQATGVHVMVIGEMANGDKTARRFQLKAKGTRAGKSADGATSKTFSFSPRLTGVDLTTLPDTLKADLSKLVGLKAKTEVKGGDNE